MIPITFSSNRPRVRNAKKSVISLPIPHASRRVECPTCVNIFVGAGLACTPYTFAVRVVGFSDHRIVRTSLGITTTYWELIRAITLIHYIVTVNLSELAYIVRVQKIVVHTAPPSFFLIVPSATFTIGSWIEYVLLASTSIWFCSTSSCVRVGGVVLGDAHVTHIALSTRVRSHLRRIFIFPVIGPSTQTEILGFQGPAILQRTCGSHTVRSGHAIPRSFVIVFAWLSLFAIVVHHIVHISNKRFLPFFSILYNEKETCC